MNERIKDFMKGAEDKIDSAERNIGLGFLKTAAHEIYYSAENAAKALLLALEGNIPNNKNKLWEKVTQLQRNGIIARFSRADIDRAYLFRTKADYIETGQAVEITEDAILSAFGTIDIFVKEVKKVLKEKNML